MHLLLRNRHLLRRRQHLIYACRRSYSAYGGISEKDPQGRCTSINAQHAFQVRRNKMLFVTHRAHGKPKALQTNCRAYRCILDSEVLKDHIFQLLSTLCFLNMNSGTLQKRYKNDLSITAEEISTYSFKLFPASFNMLLCLSAIVEVLFRKREKEAFSTTKDQIANYVQGPPHKQ